MNLEAVKPYLKSGIVAIIVIAINQILPLSIIGVVQACEDVC